MTIIRTPEHRFESVTDYPFEPHYVDIRDLDGTPLRMHYVDEGPRDAPIVLMLHGEPTWSFLYRKIIPVLTAAGQRAIAPDLVGFGRSDKFAERSAYTYARHVAWAYAFIAALDLRELTLICQDWGGLIGLRLVAEHPERFARVIAANTSLPTGDRPMPPEFAEWQRASQEDPVFSAGEIVQRYSSLPLSIAARSGYDAPFPDESYKAAAREFPMLVPTTPNDPASEPNRRAWDLLAQFRRPFLTVFGDQDPFSSGGERVLQKRIPGAAGQPHRVLSGVGHFIQEDAGEELGRIAASFVAGR
ncbi:haloalkane dehalogenase [Pendulispora albinea]|uniref:Haloalkane dehalogenase n=1 Tax=Pendulispora albinea TaxID=2741071 RepID=A0ABZ2M192_9BACT